MILIGKYCNDIKLSINYGITVNYSMKEKFFFHIFFFKFLNEILCPLLYIFVLYIETYSKCHLYFFY